MGTVRFTDMLYELKELEKLGFGLNFPNSPVPCKHEPYAVCVI